MPTTGLSPAGTCTRGLSPPVFSIAWNQCKVSAPGSSKSANCCRTQAKARLSSSCALAPSTWSAQERVVPDRAASVAETGPWRRVLDFPCFLVPASFHSVGDSAGALPAACGSGAVPHPSPGPPYSHPPAGLALTATWLPAGSFWNRSRSRYFDA